MSRLTHNVSGTSENSEKFVLHKVFRVQCAYRVLGVMDPTLLFPFDFQTGRQICIGTARFSHSLHLFNLQLRVLPYMACALFTMCVIKQPRRTRKLGVLRNLPLSLHYIHIYMIIVICIHRACFLNNCKNRQIEMNLLKSCFYWHITSNVFQRFLFYLNLINPFVFF